MNFHLPRWVSHPWKYLVWCLLLADIDNIELTHKYELAIRLTELVHSSQDEFSLLPSEGRLWFRPVLIIRWHQGPLLSAPPSVAYIPLSGGVFHWRNVVIASSYTSCQMYITLMHWLPLSNSLLSLISAGTFCHHTYVLCTHLWFAHTQAGLCTFGGWEG